jgi:hypothetical protein
MPQSLRRSQPMNSPRQIAPRSPPTSEDALRFVRRVSAVASPSSVDATRLRERILASRAEGTRVLLPVPPQQRPSTHRLWSRPAAWAMAAAAAFAVVATMRSTVAGATEQDSELTLTPALPRAGEVVRVRYRPVDRAMASAARLHLRARLRTVDDESYASAVPDSQLRVLATLERDGDVFTARVVLPEPYVYAALAVETPDAVVVDDRNGRAWELMRGADRDRPSFDALYQRTQDMMGRSWEEGFASIQRATELYPNVVEGWHFRELFDFWLLSPEAADSVGRPIRAQIDRLVAAAKTQPRLSSRAMGDIFYRSYRTVRSARATARDSAEFWYWQSRLEREYPRHEQLAQRLAIDMNVSRIDTVAALDSLDRLFASFAPLRGGANNVRYKAEFLLSPTDTARTRRWLGRSLIARPDSVTMMAIALASRPALRMDGMAAVRAVLRDTTIPRLRARGLGTTRARYLQLEQDVTRRLYAALGRALAATGNTDAARDTLALATRDGWEPSLFAPLRRTYLQLGDSVNAARMSASSVVDVRTSPSARDSLARDAVRAVGAQRWAALVDSARHQMHTYLLARSGRRTLRGTGAVERPDGSRASVQDLFGEAATVVIFWSEQCGYAIEQLPEIRTLIRELQARNVPTHFVVQDMPSAQRAALRKKHDITWPITFDRDGSLERALANFGTPTMYVVDGLGRVRFGSNDKIIDVVGQVEAVKSEAAR